jgi:hypothetical protein
MLSGFLLCAALLRGPAAPVQAAPPDTTRQFRGYANLTYAWGALELRKGKRLHAYLPTGSARGLWPAMPYYLQAPGPGPLPKPKLLAAPNVRWMRIGSQYWELLGNSRQEEGQLARRLQAGTVELFLAQAESVPILTALGSNPVLSSPADATLPDLAASPANWFLRRPGTAPVLVSPANFASQVAGFLNDDPELARHVAAGEAGYRYAELESIIQRYNQRARH